MRHNRAHHVLIWLALAVSIEAGHAQVVGISADVPLVEALELVGEGWFVASDGSPQAITAGSRLVPGQHRILLLQQGADGELQARRWLELAVAGTPTPGLLADVDASLAGNLWLDSDPPVASFSVVGAVADAEDRLLAAPDATVRLTWQDGSGVKSWRISDSHPQSSQGRLWLNGEHRLTASAVDGVGNVGGAGELVFVVDGQGPEIDWSVSSQGLENGQGETIYRQPVQLAITASDPAGVRRITVLENGHSRPVEVGQALSVTADTVTIEALDGLGNAHTTSATWRYDLDGPAITLVPEVPGKVRGNRITLPVQGAVAVQVSDSGAGLESARYRYNFKPWKPLPERIRFINRGRYKVEVEAVDRLGNLSVNRFEVRATRAARSSRNGARP